MLDEQIYKEHLVEILEVFKKEKLYAKIGKYEILLKNVAVLGHVVFEEEVCVDLKKIEAIVDWSRTTSMTTVRSFLDLFRYYHKFIEGFSLLAIPLSRLCKNRLNLFRCLSKRKVFKS